MRPTRVNRKSSVVKGFSPGNGGRIVRNLYIVKISPCNPGRWCRKTTGEPEVHRISSAITANRGESKIRSADATNRSNPRFSHEPRVQSGDMIRGSSVKTGAEERPNERMYSIDLGIR